MKLIAPILRYNCVKCLRVTKIVKESGSERLWDELKSKKCFQRQALIKHLRLTQVFMRNSNLQETFNCCFSRFFVSIIKIFILAVTLSSSLAYYSMKF